jgi:D-alanine--poly(phosphoribitol) ligase subunit 2
MTSIEDVRNILRGIASLSGAADGLGEDDDLFARGLDSFGSVQLMLALEERYDVEFPDHLLNRRSFSTIRTIRDTVATLTVGVAA